MALIRRRYVSPEVRNKRQPRVGKKNPNPSKRLMIWQRFLPCWVLPAPVGPAGAERGHGEPRDSGARLRAALIHPILYAALELLQHCPDRPVSGTLRSRELSSQTRQAPSSSSSPRTRASHAEQRGSGPPPSGARPSRPASGRSAPGPRFAKRAEAGPPAPLLGLGALRLLAEPAARGPAIPCCRRSLGSGWVRGWGKRRRPRAAGPGRGRAEKRSPPPATSLRCSQSRCAAPSPAALLPVPLRRVAPPAPGAARSRSAPPRLPPRLRPVSARLGPASGLPVCVGRFGGPQLHSGYLGPISFGSAQFGVAHVGSVDFGPTWLNWAQLRSFCFTLVLAGRARSWTRGTHGTAQPRHACPADAHLMGVWHGDLCLPGQAALSGTQESKKKPYCI